MWEDDGEDYTEVERERVFDEARAKGFQVVTGRPSLILLDLDGEEAWKVYDEAMAFLKKWLEADEVQRWYSKSGPPNTHVVVSIPVKLDAGARIALGVALGSDRKRAILGVRRIIHGIKEPEALFVPPGVVLDPSIGGK